MRSLPKSSDRFFAGSNPSTMHCMCDKTFSNVQAHSFELWLEVFTTMQACSFRLRIDTFGHASMSGRSRCETPPNMQACPAVLLQHFQTCKHVQACCHTKPRRARHHHDPAPSGYLLLVSNESASSIRPDHKKATK